MTSRRPARPSLAQRAWQELQAAGVDGSDVVLPDEVLALCNEMAQAWSADACTPQWNALLRHYGAWGEVPGILKTIVRRGRELADEDRSWR